MGTDYYLKTEEGTKYHIGKNSGGWQFLFSFEIFLVWFELGDSRWNFVEGYEKKECSHCSNPPLRPHFIPGVFSTDVWDILRMGKIFNEDDDEISFSEFQQMVEWSCHGVNGFSYDNEVNDMKDFTREYYVGFMRFQPGNWS